MKRLALILPLLLFFVLIYFFMKALPEDPSKIPSALVGQTFPEFSLPTLSGQAANYQALAGKMHLVNVWATWCAACRAEHPFFMSLAKQGVLIMGLDYKELDNGDDARQWLIELGDPYVFSVFDKEGRLGLNLGVSGAPETFLVDASGVILYRHTGILTPALWKQYFVPLMAESNSKVSSSHTRGVE